MEWLESTAGEKLAAYADQKPRSFTVTAAEGLTAREDLFQRRGYRPVRTYYKMRCELSRNAEKPNIPEGFAFAAYSQEVDSDVHRMIDTAFSEHKKYQPHTPDLWALHTYRSQDFCPEASGLVYEGDTLAGASVCSIWAEDNARLGVQEGWVDMLGVLKEYRKRGIASALLLQAMNSFRALGMDYAGLFVDSENETGALALYERLGFRRIMSAIRWTKQLDLD
jgi:ribosomal protein S18 acetylase RimI-like enzyme